MNKSRLVVQAAALTMGAMCLSVQGATFTYSPTSSGTTQWSAGTDWDSVPVSATDTILNIAGTLTAGNTVVSNNDITGTFQLNQLNFTTVGPTSGTAPTVTFSGNPLAFNNASARVYYNTTNITGTTSASRPQLIINNNLVLNSDLSVYANTDGPTPLMALNGAITGSGKLTFGKVAGANATFVLGSTANAYSGDTVLSLSSTSIRTFTVRLGASEVIPNGVGKGNVVLQATSESGTPVVELNGFNETINGLSSVVPASSSGNALIQRIRNTSATAATLTLGDNDATASFIGAIEDGTGGGALSVTKIGTGVQTLSGVSTHTGNTTINAGSIVSNYNVFATSQTAAPSNYFSSTSDLVLNGGTTFGIVGRENGAALSVNNLAVTSGSRSITLTNAQASGLAVGQLMTFTKNSGTGTVPASAFIVAIGDPGPTTTIVTLSARVANSGSANVNLVTNATVASTTQTLKSLTLSGAAGQSAALDFGLSNNVVLTINAAPVQLVNGSILNITNWSGNSVTGGGADQLIFTGTPSDFTNVFSQSEVTFAGYGTGYVIIPGTGNYEVIPVPEPTTLGLVALGGIGLLARKRRV